MTSTLEFETLPAVVLDGQREMAADLEAVDAERGTILMRAAPYNREIQLAERIWESFSPGTFAKAAEAPHRVKLFHEHSNTPHGRLIGHALTVEDRADGIWIEAQFSNTVAGQEARELARDGTLDQVSVEFKPMRDWIRQERRDDGLHVRHSRAHLKGVALVPHGAYSEHAAVMAVRSETDATRAAEEAAREQQRAQAQLAEAERHRAEALARLDALNH